ncbi:MAG: type II toxin-antitoxin system VapC family toxin [Actinomycetota bacterium]|nr:type II toxin-antitoxin system VapC family toxin [Actinomycetota bacterium]
MRRFFFDTNIFVYALGGDHPLRGPCRVVLERAEGGELRGEASVELVQELVHQRYRQTRQRAAATRAARRVAEAVILHPFEPADLPLALDLFDHSSRMTSRDACLAAVALNREVGAMLSADRDFDDVPGLERVDPADEVAVAGLSRRVSR